MRLAAATVALSALSACGPSFAPADAPTRACERIDRAAFDAAIAGGAVHAVANLGEISSIGKPTGVVHCATYSGSTLKPCRRPDDFVLEARMDGQEPFYVKIPKNTDYRFHANLGADFCKIILPYQAPS